MGRSSCLHRALHNLAIAELLLGSLSNAESQFAAGRNLVAPQSTLIDLGDLLVLAWAAPPQLCAPRPQSSCTTRPPKRAGWMVGYIEYTLATLELSVGGHYREALIHVNAALDADSYLLSAVLSPDAVEAAVRSNQPDAAATALAVSGERLASAARRSRSGCTARAQALISSDERAEDHYQASIDALRHVHGSTHIARTHLNYGEWLRRRGRRVNAREQLRTALDLFETMGAQNFARRSRSELEATGEKVRQRSVETRNALTPQEAEVARLAASGDDQRRDRREHVHQPEHRRLSPAQGLPKARHRVAAATRCPRFHGCPSRPPEQNVRSAGVHRRGRVASRTAFGRGTARHAWRDKWRFRRTLDAYPSRCVDPPRHAH